MSLLSFLGPAVTAATQAESGALAGQEAGRNEANSKMMAMIQQIRAAHDDELKNQLTTSDIALKNAQTAAGGFRPQPGDKPTVHQLDDGTLVQIGADGKARRIQMGDQPTPAASAPAAPANPEDTQVGASGPSAPPQAPQSATQGTPAPTGVKGPAKAPVMGSPEWLAAEDAAAAIREKHAKPTVPHFTPQTTTGPNGEQIIQPFNTSTGELGAAVGNAKGAGGAGGQTRLPERSQQLGLALNNAVEALPFHDQAAETGAPGMVAGYLAQHSQSGSLPARGALNLTESGQKYERYTDAMNGALLAVAHSVGGARISKEQVNMFGGNMMVSPNDPPATIQQKTRAIIDFMNSARATLPPDAVAKQEAGMSPAALSYLKSKGYGNAPTQQGMALVGQIKSLGGEQNAPASDNVSTVKAALKAGTVKQADVLNSTKLTPAEKQAILKPE